jgi:tetratricopeptide (TPR) repeat protein
VGDTLLDQGEREKALEHYRTSLDIRRKVAGLDSGNPDWQRSLSLSYERLGDALAEAGNHTASLASYRDRLVIAQKLAALDPHNGGWKRDLAVAELKLAEAGDDPARRWREVVRILRAMKDAGQLAASDEPLLSAAETELAKHAPSE